MSISAGRIRQAQSFSLWQSSKQGSVGFSYVPAISQSVERHSLASCWICKLQGPLSQCFILEERCWRRWVHPHVFALDALTLGCSLSLLFLPAFTDPVSFHPAQVLPEAAQAQPVLPSPQPSPQGPQRSIRPWTQVPQPPPLIFSRGFPSQPPLPLPFENQSVPLGFKSGLNLKRRKANLWIHSILLEQPQGLLIMLMWGQWLYLLQ